ncbi:MAG: hypothetical protein ACK44H_04590 [Candidatus Kryptonium sp.]
MRLGFVLMLLFFFVQFLYSQSDTASFDLLPKKLSLVEKTLWGKQGLFRLVGVAPLTFESREKELRLRRTMLSLHQLGGFITVGLMTGTVYYGQQVFNGKYELINKHRNFVKATVVSYYLTASLALFSPPPLIRHEKETSSISIHKALAWVHFTGMISTPILGLSIKKTSDPDKAHRLRQIHQISGYITLASLTGAMIVVALFK